MGKVDPLCINHGGPRIVKRKSLKNLHPNKSSGPCENKFWALCVKSFKRALSLVLASFYKKNHCLAICISQFTVVLNGSEKKKKKEGKVFWLVLRWWRHNLIYTRTATKHSRLLMKVR